MKLLEVNTACDLQRAAALETLAVTRLGVAQVAAIFVCLARGNFFHPDEIAALGHQVGHQHLHGLRVLVKPGGSQHVVKAGAKRLVEAAGAVARQAVHQLRGDGTSWLGRAFAVVEGPTGRLSQQGGICLEDGLAKLLDACNLLRFALERIPELAPPFGGHLNLVDGHGFGLLEGGLDIRPSKVASSPVRT